MEFTNQISPVTPFALLGWSGTVGVMAFLFRLGGRSEATTNYGKRIEALEKAEDVRATAFNMRIDLSAKQLAEFREEVAKTYAAAESVEKVEDRLSNNFDRVLNRLDEIGGRLEQLTDRLIDVSGGCR